MGIQTNVLLPAVVILASTGLYAILLHVLRVQALVTTPYGRPLGEAQAADVRARHRLGELRAARPRTVRPLGRLGAALGTRAAHSHGLPDQSTPRERRIVSSMKAKSDEILMNSLPAPVLWGGEQGGGGGVQLDHRAQVCDVQLVHRVVGLVVPGVAVVPHALDQHGRGEAGFPEALVVGAAQAYV